MFQNLQNMEKFMHCINLQRCKNFKIFKNKQKLFSKIKIIKRKIVRVYNLMTKYMNKILNFRKKMKKNNYLAIEIIIR